MKREQIITIMKKGFEEMAFREASKREMSYFKESADAILALDNEVELREQDNYPNIEDDGWMTDRNHRPD